MGSKGKTSCFCGKVVGGQQTAQGGDRGRVQGNPHGPADPADVAAIGSMLRKCPSGFVPTLREQLATNATFLKAVGAMP